MRNIKLILADDNDNTRSSIRQLLELDHSIDIVAEVRTGREVIEKIQVMEPEIVLMDVNMPEMDGIEATRYITLHHPGVFVILISVSDEMQNIKKAMMAGAKEYLVKPLSPNELNATIRQVAELNRQQFKIHSPKTSAKETEAGGNEHRVISIFGTKGGVGKSVICTNLAVAMAGHKPEKSVGLVDLDIQFGDVSVMMNVNPRKTIAELVQEGEDFSRDLFEDYIYERNKVNILAAPNKPEFAELVSAASVEKILKICRSIYDYTFIDTPSFIDDVTLTALERSNLIFLVISLDLPTIKNVKKGIDVLRSLQLLSKTRLILNRSSGIAGIEPRDVERVLDMKIKAEVPSDGKLVVASLNQGIPFVKMNPRAPVSKGIMSIIKLVNEK